jgi:hypothetical protein
MSTAPDPSSQPEAPDPLTALTARQRELVGILADKDEGLGQMLVGAIMARAATNNPDHLGQASHSLRELIEKLPPHFDAVLLPTDTQTNKVATLAVHWSRERRVKNKSDEALSTKFVQELHAFFQWRDDNLLTRRDAARRAISKFDPSGRSLPTPIEELHAQEWMKIRDFFVGSAHHHACTTAEFDTWYNAFENFMLNRLRPRTFENADKLDALIQEGES